MVMIKNISTELLDIPIKRPHQFSTVKVHGIGEGPLRGSGGTAKV
ncbi:hypothetical protein ACE1TI_00740 [Alteribacillus sp. JSM 102045]